MAEPQSQAAAGNTGAGPPSASGFTDSPTAPDSRTVVSPGTGLASPTASTPSPPYLHAWKSISEAGLLEETKPKLADTLFGLPWLKDGLDDGELTALRELVRLELKHGAESRPALAGRDWVADGVGELEIKLMSGLLELGAHEFLEIEQVLSLSFLDSVEPADAETLLELLALADSSPQLYPTLLAKPWVGDGLDDPEKEVLITLRNMSVTDLESALQLADIPFLNDFEPTDALATSLLAGLAGSEEALYSALLGKLWVQDGLEDTEATVIETLEFVASRENGTELQLITLPFLDQIEASDIDTIHMLDFLAGEERTRPLYDALLQKWWIEDGLQGDEVALVSTLGGPGQYDRRYRTRTIGHAFPRSP